MQVLLSRRFGEQSVVQPTAVAGNRPPSNNPLILLSGQCWGDIQLAL
jgi:hypothetical protein